MRQRGGETQPLLSAWRRRKQTKIAWDLNAASCRREFLHRDFSGPLSCLPEIIHHLHAKPGFRRELQEQIEPLICGGGQQNGLRSGTVPLPLCVGFGAAARLLAAEAAPSERRSIAGQRNRLVDLLRAYSVPFEINGPAAMDRHPGNANLCFPGYDARDILGALQPQLAAATGAACSTGIPEPSHVLRAIGLSSADCEASVRFSFGRFTSGAEVDAAAGLVECALDELNAKKQ